MQQISIRLAAFILIALVAPAGAETRGVYFAVIVSDIDASTEWYRSTLGLSLGAQLGDGTRYKIANLRKPGIFVELLELQAASERPEGRIEGPFKVGLLVDDLSAFIAQLPDSVSEPEVIVDPRNNLLLLQLSDPDGNIVQVMEERAANGHNENQ